MVTDRQRVERRRLRAGLLLNWKEQTRQFIIDTLRQFLEDLVISAIAVPELIPGAPCPWISMDGKPL